MKNLFSLSMFLVLLCAFCAQASEKKFVRYEDFGAKGDGKTDDFPALIRAHEYANEKGLPVRARDNAVYYLGNATRTIVVKTDTDFGKARVVIDDRDIKSSFFTPVFKIAATRSSFQVKGVTSLRKGAANLGTTLPCPCLVILEDKETKRFIRMGVNENDGSPQTEVLIVHPDGTIDPKTPVLWDYAHFSSIEACPMDEKVLTIRGGHFETISNNDTTPGFHYYARNLSVQRSNVLIDGITHTVTGDAGKGGMPYTSFLSIGRCANVKVANSRFTGRRRTHQGTYDLSGYCAASILYYNCVQLNNINDFSLWGIMGTNFCKDITLDHCCFSRFDAHQGVTGAVIRNCELGYAGINAIGAGTLLVENTVNNSWNFINLREDYGCHWDGDIVIRNCTFNPSMGKGPGCIVGGSNDGSHNFGYPCRMPRQILIDGLKINNGGSDQPAVLFSDFDKNGKKGDVKPFPYTYAEKVVLKRVKTQNGKKLKLSPHPELFDSVQIEGLKVN